MSDRKGVTLRRHASAVLAAAFVVGCGGGDVAPVPPRYAERVAGARESLQREWDGFGPRPHFSFLAIRCRIDGGILVLFAQRGLGGDSRLALAYQGGSAMVDSWGGGFSVVDTATDPEIEAFFTFPMREVPCPL